MASTVTATTLKVTVKEDITINGEKHEHKVEKSIPDINMISQRIVRVPISAQTNLMTFGSSPAAGSYVPADTKYIRITNLDDTNFLTLQVKATGSDDTAYFKMQKSETMILYNAVLDTNTNAAAFSSFANLLSIAAQADTAAIDVEVFVASSQS